MQQVFTLVPLILLISGCASVSSSDKEAAELHLRIGTAQLQNGAYPQALSSLLKAESLDPKNAVVQNNLGLAYYVRERYGLAEEHLRKALDLSPEYSDARNNLGRILIDEGRYPEALIELQKVVNDLTYDHPEKPHINIGLAYFKLGQYEKAKESFSKVLDIQRDNCLAHSYFGRSLFELRQFQASAVALDRAVGFCQRSQFDEPHYYSALAYYELNKKDLAEARLEEMLKLYPQGPYAEKAKTLLETIKR